MLPTTITHNKWSYTFLAFEGMVLDDLFDFEATGLGVMGAGVTGLGVMGAGVIGAFTGALVGESVSGVSSKPQEKPVKDPVSTAQTKPAQAQVVKSVSPLHSSPG